MSFRLFHKYLDEIKILSRLQKFNSRPVSIGKVSWSQLKTKERSELQRGEVKVSRSPRQFHAYQTRSSSLEATSVKTFSPNKSVFEYKHPTKAPRISNHFNLSGVSDNKEDSQNWMENVSVMFLYFLHHHQYHCENHPSDMSSICNMNL